MSDDAKFSAVMNQHTHQTCPCLDSHAVGECPAVALVLMARTGQFAVLVIGHGGLALVRAAPERLVPLPGYVTPEVPVEFIDEVWHRQYPPDMRFVRLVMAPALPYLLAGSTPPTSFACEVLELERRPYRLHYSPYIIHWESFSLAGDGEICPDRWSIEDDDDHRAGWR